MREIPKKAKHRWGAAGGQVVEVSLGPGPIFLQLVNQLLCELGVDCFVSVLCDCVIFEAVSIY